MTPLDFLLYATHIVSWLHLMILTGAGFVVATPVSCMDGQALIVWTGGSWDEALDLLQRASWCRA